MIDAFRFAGGLVLLLAGGEALVRGASALALRLGVAPVLVGMTIVAFGTSTPELAVSVIAARAGSGDIAIGNIVGSNIANIGLLLGITALFWRVSVARSIARREIPMMLVASAAFAIVALDGMDRRIVRTDGLLLLLFFSMFLYYSINDARRQRAEERPPGEEGRGPGGGAAALLALAGIAAVVGGGHFLVEGAIGLGRWLGVSESVIGLTAVAVGTSLPEMATTMIAARRGQPDIAVGNIVGSNIFNSLFIGGISSSLAPMSLPAHGATDLAVMGAFSLALFPLLLSGRGLLGRPQGLLFLAGYGYYVYALAQRDSGG